MKKTPKNNITISRSGNNEAKPPVVDTRGRKVQNDAAAPAPASAQRSFAQPSPAAEQAPQPVPKAHASKDEKRKALKDNSVNKRDYQDGDEAETNDEAAD